MNNGEYGHKPTLGWAVRVALLASNKRFDSARYLSDYQNIQSKREAKRLR